MRVCVCVTEREREREMCAVCACARLRRSGLFKCVGALPPGSRLPVESVLSSSPVSLTASLVLKRFALFGVNGPNWSSLCVCECVSVFVCILRMVKGTETIKDGVPLCNTLIK